MNPAARAAALRAKAYRQRPGSTLIREYLQDACAIQPGHDFVPTRAGWAECVHCQLVVQQRG